MASAMDLMFAYHWIYIGVEIEHYEAQTSQAQHIIKRKIEELIVKEGEVLARKTASSRIIAETAVSSTSANEDVQQNDSEQLPLKLPRLLKKYSRIRSGKNLQKRQKNNFYGTLSLLVLSVLFIGMNRYCFGTKRPMLFLLSVRLRKEYSVSLLRQRK